MVRKHAKSGMRIYYYKTNNCGMETCKRVVQKHVMSGTQANKRATNGNMQKSGTETWKESVPFHPMKIIDVYCTKKSEPRYTTCQNIREKVLSRLIRFCLLGFFVLSTTGRIQSSLMCLIPGLGAGTRYGMVQTTVVGFVDGHESGTGGVVENPEGWGSRNDEGDGIDGANDSRGPQEDDAKLARWGAVHGTAREAAMAAWYCSSSSSSRCRACRFCISSASGRCFSCSKNITTGSWAVSGLRAAISSGGRRTSTGTGVAGTASLPRCLDES